MSAVRRLRHGARLPSELRHEYEEAYATYLGLRTGVDARAKSHGL